MSPQPSNRQALIEGALHCIEKSPSSRITTRQIASAAKANIGSIRYHFGSTDALVATALEEGFRRWLVELTHEMGEIGDLSPVERIQRASQVVAVGVKRRGGLVRVFLAALARAPHDGRLRGILAESYSESRHAVASLLGLGDDDDARFAASLILATFDGLLIQEVLNPDGPALIDEVGRGIYRLASIAQQ